MDLHPETATTSSPTFASIGRRSLKDMSISELISVLRADFDTVEEVLLARDAKHRAEISPLYEKIELERLTRLRLESELKTKQEEQRCHRCERTQEGYEMLLKEVKKSGLNDYKNNAIIEELRNTNRELEIQNNKATDELATIRIRCSQLENARNVSLATIEKLRVENCKLRKELNKGVNVVVKDEQDKEFNEMDVCGSASLQRIKDIGQGQSSSGGLFFKVLDMDSCNNVSGDAAFEAVAEVYSESDDDGHLEPVPRMEFDSLEAVQTFYKRYARLIGFGWKIRTSKKGFDGRPNYVVLACTRGDRRLSSISTTLPTQFTKCSAKINVKKGKDGKWMIRKVDLEHNHDLSPLNLKYSGNTTISTLI
ncbi:hypothetical protein AHAS_Ahas04G0014200 [Arachis hypogaea]